MTVNSACRRWTPRSWPSRRRPPTCTWAGRRSSSRPTTRVRPSFERAPRAHRRAGCRGRRGTGRRCGRCRSGSTPRCGSTTSTSTSRGTWWPRGSRPARRRGRGVHVEAAATAPPAVAGLDRRPARRRADRRGRQGPPLHGRRDRRRRARHPAARPRPRRSAARAGRAGRRSRRPAVRSCSGAGSPTWRAASSTWRRFPPAPRARRGGRSALASRARRAAAALLDAARPGPADPAAQRADLAAAPPRPRWLGRWTI